MKETYERLCNGYNFAARFAAYENKRRAVADLRGRRAYFACVGLRQGQNTDIFILDVCFVIPPAAVYKESYRAVAYTVSIGIEEILLRDGVAETAIKRLTVIVPAVAVTRSVVEKHTGKSQSVIFTFLSL